VSKRLKLRLQQTKIRLFADLLVTKATQVRLFLTEQMDCTAIVTKREMEPNLSQHKYKHDDDPRNVQIQFAKYVTASKYRKKVDDQFPLVSVSALELVTPLLFLTGDLSGESNPPTLLLSLSFSRSGARLASLKASKNDCGGAKEASRPVGGVVGRGGGDGKSRRGDGIGKGEEVGSSGERRAERGTS
jgi:hypothetical protein